MGDIATMLTDYYFVFSFLPAPTQLSQDQLEAEERLRAQKSYSTALVASRKEPPPYGHRKGWVPRAIEVNPLIADPDFKMYLFICSFIKPLFSAAAGNGWMDGILLSYGICLCRTLEMEELSQRSMWPSFHWRWVERRWHLMPWLFKWMQKEKLNMMPLPDKDRTRTR